MAGRRKVAKVWVRAYERSDGTYVEGHWRRDLRRSGRGRDRSKGTLVFVASGRLHSPHGPGNWSESRAYGETYRLAVWKAPGGYTTQTDELFGQRPDLRGATRRRTEDWLGRELYAALDEGLVYQVTKNTDKLRAWRGM